MKNKTAEVLHPFKIKFKKNKQKLLLHWLDFPSREISTATTAVGPVCEPAGSPSNGEHAAARKESLLTKEHFLNVF